MKKIIIAFYLFLSVTVLFAQDIITKKDGEQIKAKVTEVTPNLVRYYLFGDTDGVIYSVAKPEVFMIQYQSGRKEVFKSDEVKPRRGNIVNPQFIYNRPIPRGIMPGMPYKKLKSIYLPSQYIALPNEQYSPGLSALASFFLPGLGQMMCGEVGRGLLFLCAPILSLPVLFVPFVGFLIYPAIVFVSQIWSILDAIKIAKIKNMYNYDLLRINQMALSPTVNLNNMELRSQNQAKLFSLKFNF